MLATRHALARRLAGGGEAAGIAVLQRGLLAVARRPEARAVLEEFMATEMGADAGCSSRREIGGHGAGLRTATSPAALYSPHEIRVESREAIPKLAAFLAERHGVTFLRETVVHSVEPRTGSKPAAAASRPAPSIVCPGDDFRTLHPERIARYGLTRCKLHMMRLAPEGFDARLPPVMSDLGMVRYLGYAELPAAARLRERLLAEQGEHLRHGVHLIVVQSADGSLVVGDSHHYAATPDPFAPDRRRRTDPRRISARCSPVRGRGLSSTGPAPMRRRPTAWCSSTRRPTACAS